MIILGGTIRVPVENIERAKPVLETFVKAVRTEPGCIEFAFAWDVVEPGLIRIFEKFEDQAALEAHRVTPHVAVWRKAQTDLGIGGRDLTQYEISNAQKL
jgi:quinol monooxygenase YgiN